MQNDYLSDVRNTLAHRAFVRLESCAFWAFCTLGIGGALFLFAALFFEQLKAYDAGDNFFMMALFIPIFGGIACGCVMQWAGDRCTNMEVNARRDFIKKSN